MYGKENSMPRQSIAMKSMAEEEVQPDQAYCKESFMSNLVDMYTEDLLTGDKYNGGPSQP